MRFVLLLGALLLLSPVRSQAQTIGLTTGIVMVQDSNYFSWKVVNTSASRSATYRVQVLHCVSGACSSVLDSGNQTIGPDSIAGHSYLVSAGQLKELIGIATAQFGTPISFSVRISPSCGSVPCTVGREIQPGDLFPVGP